MQSRTLVKPTPVISGVGLHTGEPCSTRILPADFGSGIKFRRLGFSQEIHAIAVNVESTTRCTALNVEGGVLLTVEHLLSALNGVGVTDALIEFDGPETPILDGSSKEFVASILAVGLISGDLEIAPIRIEKPFTMLGPGGGVATAVPANSFWATVVLDYADKSAMQPQAATFTGVNYASEIASARTYGFVSELEYLARMGLAKGASAENAFGLNEDGTADQSTPLRFPNEPARHKTLDLIGDLVFAGRPVCAGIVALRPSHTLNICLAAEFAKLAAHTKENH